MYWKLINGKLICSNEYYFQGEYFISDDEEQLLQYGYKPIIFSKPDFEEDCLGYVSRFEETDSDIIQKWEKVKPNYDMSDDYFKVSKETDAKFDILINNIVKIQKEDDSRFYKITKEFPWLGKIYELWKNKDITDRRINPNIPTFLSEYAVLDDVLKDGFKIDGDYLIDKDVPKDYMDIPLKKLKGRIISCQFIKSNLYTLNSCENHTSFQSITNFKMIYQYGVLVFDEFIIDSIRIVLKSNKISMISNRTMDIKDIIECDDYESVIDKILNDLLEDKEFEGISEKIAYLEKHGICINYPNNMDIQDVSFINEKRNCIVHNHSIFSKISYSRLKKEKNKHIDRSLPVDFI